MIEALKSLYRRQMYLPSLLGIFVNPFYLARVGLARAMIELSPLAHNRMLDVGCGTKPYRELFKVESYVGLDIDSDISRKRDIADFFYSGTEFPLLDNSFDFVLCSQVLEHVFNPNEFLGEINRILKSKGRLLLTVPFVWDEHEQPYDYARYSSFGLLALLKNNGFNVLQHRKIGGDTTLFFQLLNAYLFKVSIRWPQFIRLMLTVTVMAFFNFLGVIAGWLLPKNPDLFLDHVVLAEKCS